MEILEYCSVKDLLIREQYYFDLSVERLGRSYVYNIGDFVESAMRGKIASPEARRKNSEAQSGKTHSIETRRKMSQAHTGKNHPFFGKHHTEETKRKISRSLAGKCLSETHKKNISKGSIGKILSKETKRKLSEAHKGKKSHTYGKLAINRKSVLQISKCTTEIIARFESISQAAKQTLGTRTQISRCCNGNGKTSGGFRWKFG